MEALGRPIDPQIVAIPSPMVVHPCIREQRDVQRVIGMMVRDDDVGHLSPHATHKVLSGRSCSPISRSPVIRVRIPAGAMTARP